MEIMLDGQPVTVNQATTLKEAFHDLDLRLHATQRIVQSMVLDGRSLTDSDLQSDLLDQPCDQYQRLVVSSLSTTAVLANTQPKAKAFAADLACQAESIIPALRFGPMDLSTFDQWLGGFADYLELETLTVQAGLPPATHGLLAPWATALLQARHDLDLVRMADLLEYEILPKLRATTHNDCPAEPHA